MTTPSFEDLARQTARVRDARMIADAGGDAALYHDEVVSLKVLTDSRDWKETE